LVRCQFRYNFSFVACPGHRAVSPGEVPVGNLAK
jgi:hypothetical protein